MKFMLDKGAFPPIKAHDLDAGYDLRCMEACSLKANTSQSIETGVHVEIPAGYAGLLISKSGLQMKDEIRTAGLIDAGYTGSIKVRVWNDSKTKDKHFEAGDKITQLVIFPCIHDEVEIVDEIQSGERGTNGFGSTGA